MKRFNLVPDSPNIVQERSYGRGRKDLDIIFAVVPVILAIVVVLFLHTKNSQNQAKLDPMLVKKYNSIKKELGNISSKPKAEEAGDINALVQEKNRLKNNLLRLRGLAESKKIPIELLIAISNNISERVALTVIDKKDRTVSIEGIAQDNESLSDFMDTLIKGGTFKTVELKLTQYSDDYGLYKQRFVMECNL
jgi:Tfp pilus assembly protein PilN